MAFVALEIGLKINRFSGLPGGTPEFRTRTSGRVTGLFQGAGKQHSYRYHPYFLPDTLHSLVAPRGRRIPKWLINVSSPIAILFRCGTSNIPTKSGHADPHLSPKYFKKYQKHFSYSIIWKSESVKNSETLRYSFLFCLVSLFENSIYIIFIKFIKDGHRKR